MSNEISLIDSGAFQRSGLHSVSLPASLSTMGSDVFLGCEELKHIELNEGLTSIADGTFMSCNNLNQITIPNSISTIGEIAFSNCSGLSEIIIPDSVSTIGRAAFNRCENLKKISIGSGTTKICSDAFSECKSLERVNITTLSSWLNITFEGCTWERYLANPLYYAHGLYVNDELLTNLIIPEDITSINPFAFVECSSLKSVTIPKNVNKIGSYAFYKCGSLIEVWNYSALKIESGKYTNGSNGYVGYYAKDIYTVNSTTKQTTDSDGYIFYEDNNNSYLLGYKGTERQLVLPEKSPKKQNYEVVQYAFYGCHFYTNVIISDGVTAIGQYAFYKCSGLTSVSVGKGLTSVGFCAFSGCNNLTGVYISDLKAWCNISFGYYDIYDSDYFLMDCITANPLYYAHNLYLNDVLVTNLSIPNGVSEIKVGAFTGCNSIQSVSLPNSIASIKMHAFDHCQSIKDFVIPDSVLSVGFFAFYHCDALQSVTIGTGCKSLDAPFSSCNNLSSAIFKINRGWHIATSAPGDHSIDVTNPQKAAKTLTDSSNSTSRFVRN